MAKTESNVNKLISLEPNLELLRTPTPPYYAVISTNIHTGKNKDQYDQIMAQVLKIAQNLDGFLGAETGYDSTSDGRQMKVGITYWKSLEAIDNWRNTNKHMDVKMKGKSEWYDEHNARICHVISHYGSNLTQKKSKFLAYR